MSELNYLPLDIVLRAGAVAQSNDDPNLLTTIITIAQDAYQKGFEDGYARALIHKESLIAGERARDQRRTERDEQS